MSLLQSLKARDRVFDFMATEASPVDVRHGPTALDMEMIEWLRGTGKPFLLVFTKADKLSRARLDRQLRAQAASGELAGLSYAPFSAQTGQGRQDVLDWILEACGLQEAAAVDSV